jgi:hypothetical protein
MFHSIQTGNSLKTFPVAQIGISYAADIPTKFSPFINKFHHTGVQIVHIVPKNTPLPPHKSKHFSESFLQYS